MFHYDVTSISPCFQGHIRKTLINSFTGLAQHDAAFSAQMIGELISSRKSSASSVKSDTLKLETRHRRLCTKDCLHDSVARAVLHSADIATFKNGNSLSSGRKNM
jgi:hypothetical protein